MEKIGNFFLKESLIKLTLINWIFWSSLTFVSIYLLVDVPMPRLYIGSLCIGALFAFLVVSMTYMSRKSVEFWNAFHILEDAVEKAEYKEDIKQIYDEQFDGVRRKAMGGPHADALNRVYAIMQTKYKLLPSKI